MNNNYKLLFLLFFAVFVFNNFLFSGNDELGVFKIDSITDMVKLDKYWKYHPGDDTLWATQEFNDTKWDTLQTTMDIEELPEGKFNGIAWFRLHFRIDTSLRNKTFALLIDQQGASEIYLNGDLIIGHGTVGSNDSVEKVYNPKLIPSLVRFNDSVDYVLSIRYSNLKAQENFKRYKQKESGFNIGIMNFDESLHQIEIMGFVRHLIISVLTIFLFIAFFHLLLYLFYRKQRSNVFFFLFMIAISSLWIIALFQLNISGKPDFMTITLFYLNLVFVMSFPLLSIFLYSIFYPKFNKLTWLTIWFIPVLAVLLLMHSAWSNKVLMAFNLLIVIDVFRNIILAIIKKKNGSWIIGSGLLLLMSFFIIAFIISLATRDNLVASPDSFVGIILIGTFVPGILSLPLSMSIYLARDFASTSKNLEKQLVNVKELSAKTIEQEHEKQRILENQKEKLENMVDKRTEELSREKEKTEELLLNTLPLKVVNELKENGKSEPESFDDVTVYFSDIVGFTDISSKLDPKTLIDELNIMFTVFDDIMEKHHCERIKTIGDAYLAVSGMPLKNEDHAKNMMNASIEIKNYLENRNNSSEVKWRIRIGIHTGKVVGGIVGVRKYIYDVFGDTINTASRMESNSEPMRINISETTYNILKDNYSFVEREAIKVKGKGSMKMYFLG